MSVSEYLSETEFLNFHLELNNSAPDHLIELKFGIINHLRMYIKMLMPEQLFFMSQLPKIDVKRPPRQKFV